MKGVLSYLASVKTYGNLGIVFYNSLAARLSTLPKVPPTYINFTYFPDVRLTVGGVSDDDQYERPGNTHGRFSPRYEASVRLRKQGAVRTYSLPLEHTSNNVLKQNLYQFFRRTMGPPITWDFTCDVTLTP
jgi:hypothetical protein